MTKKLRVSIVLAAVACAAVAFTAPAGAHFEKSPYSFGSSSCTNGDFTDPISFVFYGSGASSTDSGHHIEHHTSWGNTSGSDQHFSSHGQCTNLDTQRGSNCCFSRWHIRLNQNADRDNRGRLITFGTPHHEDLTSCGHAVDSNGDQGSGFDQGRHELVRQFRGQHTFGDSVHWGNTRSMRQCDGDYAGSNGTVVWYQIGTG